VFSNDFAKWSGGPDKLKSMCGLHGGRLTRRHQRPGERPTKAA
jgi:hypothetical protein